MRLTETLLLYGCIGMCCGVYQARIRQDSSTTRLLLLLLSIPFWPLLLPLLTPQRPSPAPKTSHHSHQRPHHTAKTLYQSGPYEARIHQGIQEIEAEMARAEGAAGHLLSQELSMLRTIAQQLHGLDHNIQEIREMIETPTFSMATIDAELAHANASGAGALALESIAIKKQNAQQLQTYLTQYTARIEDSLALLSRLHSQIALLRFSGQEGPQLSGALEQLLHLLDGLGEASAIDLS